MTNRDKELPGMNITISAIASCTNISDCMTIEEIRSATVDNEQLSMLSEYVLHSWPSMRAVVQKELQMYWSFRDDIVIIDGITIKDERIITPVSLYGKVWNQMHMNHMGIEKSRLLACEFICCPFVKNCPTCLDFQAMQPKDKNILHEIPVRLWES